MAKKRPDDPTDPGDPGPLDPGDPPDRPPRPEIPPPPPPPPLPPEGANPSITSWTRLEVRSRQADMRVSLSARVFDPLWLLARQWQVGEFQGEDAGMPVLARVRSQTTMLSRIHLGELPANTITQAAAYDPQQMPLEVMVERQRTRPANAERCAHAAFERRGRTAFPADARAAAALQDVSGGAHCALRAAATRSVRAGQGG